MISAILGWDIGGVNTKVAAVVRGRVLAAHTRPFELQRAPEALTGLLRELASEVCVDPVAAHGVTMTAELSQMFRTKRDGVAFVLHAAEAAFPSVPMHVFATDGRFLTPEAARLEPLAVAAANWAATARVAAWSHPDALLVDVGSTTTDIIPIVGGQVVASGLTDPERLASSELVYTGVIRTPIEAILREVPCAGSMTGVSAEGFSLAGDAYVWRGDLQPDEYQAPTPDGRPATREFAGERLARVVCADRDLLDEQAVSAIADAVAAAQQARIAAAIARVRRRHPTIRLVALAGVGAFLGERAALGEGLDAARLDLPMGPAAAVSVALLLGRLLGEGAVVG